MPKKLVPGNTVKMGVGVAPAVARDIDALIQGGYFKDRSDFLNQAALAFLEAEKKRLSEDSYELKIPLSPGRPGVQSRHEGQRPDR